MTQEPQRESHCHVNGRQSLPLLFKAIAKGRIIAAALLIIVLVPTFWLLGRISRRFGQFLSLVSHRIALKLLGISVKTYGLENLASGPSILIGNHQSWLDIPVLGSVRRVTFVSHTTLASGALGIVADVQHTLYVDRTNRQAVDRDIDMIVRYLNKGERIVIFPEGTTSNGNQLVKFKSSLFSVVDRYKKQKHQRTLPIQPVTILYCFSHGIGMGRDIRSKVAWYGDTSFSQGIRNVCESAPLEVAVIFHPPLESEMTKNRKVMAAACEEIIRDTKSKFARGVALDDLAGSSDNTHN